MVWRHRLKTAKYCSESCKNVAMNPWRNRIELRVERALWSLTCKFCGEFFEVENYRKSVAKYCSVECKNKDKKREVRTCQGCKVSTFTVYPSDSKKYCTHECWSAHRARSSVAELSLKPFLEPLGYRNTESSPFYLRNKVRGRTRVPDYVNQQERKIVEVWGEYWHRDQILPEGKRHETVEECVEWYREIGWSCEVVWVEDLDNYKQTLELRS